MIGEAMECLGGNGYVEESVMPRLYREAPVNSIWEGSGNVMCLDVLRAAVRDPESLPAFLDEVREARGADRRLDARIAELENQLARPADIELRARRVVESMAVALQASLLVRHAPALVSDSFCMSRIMRDGGLAYGTLPPGVDCAGIVERALPPL
jgi:putative acyl-CoA dehydrogenase